MAWAAKLMQSIKVSSLVPFVRALFQGLEDATCKGLMYTEKSCLNVFEDAKSFAPLCGMGNRKLQTYMGNDSSCA